MSFREQIGGDRNVTFALTPSDYAYELKLARYLYNMDKLDEPTIEDLAVWAHNFAIGALSKILGQMYLLRAKKTQLEEEGKKALLPDFDKLIPNPLEVQQPQVQVQTQTQTQTQQPQENDLEKLGEKISTDIQKELFQWLGEDEK